MGIIIPLVVAIISEAILPQDSKEMLKQADDINAIRQIVENQPQYDFPIVKPNNANSYYYQGINFYNEGKYEIAIDKFEKAIDDQTKAQKLDELDSARCYYAIGNAHYYLMDYNNAITHYGNALGILELLKLNEDETTISSDEIVFSDVSKEISYVYYLRSNSYLKIKDHDRAFDDFNKIGMDVYFGQNEFVSQSEQTNLKGDLLHSYAYQCEDEERVHYFREAFKEYNTAFNRSLMYSKEKGYKDLTEQEANARLEEGAPIVNLYLIDPGTVLALKLEDGTTIQFDGKPIEILGREKDIAITLTNRSKMYLIFGLEEEAIKDSNAALTIYRDLSLNENQNIYDTYWNLMLAYLMKDDLESSKIYMQIAVDKQKNWYGAESIQTAIAYEIMGSVYLADNDFDLATDCFTEAKRIFELHDMPEDAQKQEDILDDIQTAIEHGGTVERIK